MIDADKDAVEARKMLHRLLNNIRYPIPENIRGDIHRTWQKSTEISNTVRNLRTYAQECPPKMRSMLNLFNYLGYVESIGVSLVDTGLVLLDANTGETHISSKPHKRQKLFDKLKILETYGLGYIAELIDRNLRNDIAHLKFEIDEDGTIRDSKKRKRNIDEIISQFWARVSTVLSFLDENQHLDLSGKRG